MSASTLLRRPRLSWTSRTALLLVLVACLAPCVLTLLASDPSVRVVVLAVAVAVSAVAVAAVVVAVVVSVTVEVAEAVVVAVEAVVALDPQTEEVLAALLVPRSLSTKRGQTCSSGGLQRVFH